MQRCRIEKQSKDVTLKALEYLKAKKGITTNTDIAVQLICDFMLNMLEGGYKKEEKLAELSELKDRLDPNPLPEDKPYETVLNGIDKAISLVKEDMDPETIVNILQSIKGVRV